MSDFAGLHCPGRCFLGAALGAPGFGVVVALGLLVSVATWSAAEAATGASWSMLLPILAMLVLTIRLGTSTIIYQ